MFYSQFYEDKNVLVPLFESIGVRNECALEVGAMDGKRFSNTRYFLDQGWTGVFIECNDEWFKHCLDNTREYGDRVLCLNREIDTKENSLDNILIEVEYPVDFDLCSIDIDGQDYHVWHAMRAYRPRVVVIEFSGDRNQDDYVPPVKTPHCNNYLGQAGRNAIASLAQRKGYRIVGQTDVNYILLDQHEIT